MPSVFESQSKTMQTLERMLCMLKEIEGAMQFTPLQPLCGIAFTIVDHAQMVRGLKADHLKLATRAAELVASIMAECSVDKAFTPDLQRRVDDLLLPLREIQDYMTAQASTGWVKAFLKKHELRQSLAEYHTKIDDCRQRFYVTSTIAMQRMLTSDTEYRTFRFDEVKLSRSLKTGKFGSLYRGQISTDFGPTKVVIKMYRKGHEGKEEFLRDLGKWRRLHHPNLHQLLGHTPVDSLDPFLVLRDYNTQNNLRHYIDQQLMGDQVDSFMSAMRLIQGIASGTEYLRWNCSLNKQELENCANGTDVVLRPDGHVVIGNNLVAAIPSQNMDVSSEQLGHWLRMVLWCVVVEIVFGKRGSIMTDWAETMCQRDGRDARHLRSLEPFLASAMGDLTIASQRLEELAERLEEPYSQGDLTRQRIRQALLDISNCSAFLHRPKEAWKAEAGDVGYVRDGRFVPLTNVRTLLDFKFTNRPLLQTWCAGEHEVDTSDDGELIRHKFCPSSYLTIRRFSSVEWVCKSVWRRGWDYLLENAATIIESHSLQHSVVATDLVMVMAIYRDSRYSSLEWNEEVERMNPPCIGFVEYKSPPPNKPWGFWVYDDDRGTVTRRTRFAQEIFMIQLEDGDM